MCRNLFPIGLFVAAAMISPRADGGSITSVNFDLTMSPTVSLSDVYLVEGYTPTLGFANQPTLYSLGSLSANTSRTFNNVPDFLYSGTSIFGGPTLNYFTILGLYDVPNGLVTIGLRDAVGASYILNSAPFGLAIPGGIVFGFSGTESTLATALENGDTATIGTVLGTLINGPDFTGLGTSAAPIVLGPSGVTGSLTLADFSDASFGGTVSITPGTATATPEPSSLALLGGGLLCLVIKRTGSRGASNRM